MTEGRDDDNIVPLPNRQDDPRTQAIDRYYAAVFDNKPPPPYPPDNSLPDTPEMALLRARYAAVFEPRPEALPAPELDAGAAQKRYSTLQAEFALNATELVRLGDGSFLAARWGMFRPLATLDDAATFLKVDQRQVL